MTGTETTVERHIFTKQQLEAAARCLATLDIVGSLLAGNVGDATFKWRPDGSLEVATPVTGVWRLQQGEMRRDDPRQA
jgi:hypothetical protein